MTGEDLPPQAAAAAFLTEAAQLAAGVLAARHRGDLDGAEALLCEFPTPQARALGFFAVAELSLAMLAQHSGEPFDDVVRELSLNIANTMSAKR